VYELPLGYPLKKMIYDVGGGIPNGRKLKAVVPGGSSTFVLTAEEAEQMNMDFDSFGKRGEFLGPAESSSLTTRPAWSSLRSA